MSLLLFQVYKLSQETTQPENICDIFFEETEDRGGIVNWTSVYAEAALQRVRRVLGEISQNSEEIYAGISFFITLLTLQICCFIKNKSLAQVFYCEFSKICKNIFLAEHHRTTLSYYSSINGNEGRIGKWKCKLWYKIKAYVPIWARSVSYQKRAALVKFE